MDIQSDHDIWKRLVFGHGLEIDLLIKMLRVYSDTDKILISLSSNINRHVAKKKKKKLFQIYHIFNLDRNKQLFMLKDTTFPLLVSTYT